MRKKTRRRLLCEARVINTPAAVMSWTERFAPTTPLLVWCTTRLSQELNLVLQFAKHTPLNCRLSGGLSLLCVWALSAVYAGRALKPAACKSNSTVLVKVFFFLSLAARSLFKLFSSQSCALTGCCCLSHTTDNTHTNTHSRVVFHLRLSQLKATVWR